MSFANPWDQLDIAGNLAASDAARTGMATMLSRLHWWAVALRDARRTHDYEKAAAGAALTRRLDTNTPPERTGLLAWKAGGLPVAGPPAGRADTPPATAREATDATPPPHTRYRWAMLARIYEASRCD